MGNQGKLLNKRKDVIAFAKKIIVAGKWSGGETEVGLRDQIEHRVINLGWKSEKPVLISGSRNGG